MTHLTENNRMYDSKKIMAVAAGYLLFNYMFSIFFPGLVAILDLPGAITRFSIIMNLKI